jgi:hypothetical protein
MNVQINIPPSVNPQLREILDNDPQLEGMRDALPGFQPERRTVKPVNPPTPGESPFVLMYLYTEDEFNQYEWTNKPTNVWLSTDVGKGLGFGSIPEKPVIKERGKRPKRRPDLFDFIGWHVASRKFIEVLGKFDADAITTMPVEWQFKDGATDDYVFFDVTRLVDAYDYRRSALDVEFKDGRRWLHDLQYPRALKPGAGDKQHIFRDSYRRRDLIVSRQLAEALVESGLRGIRFTDLATGQTLDLAHIEFTE